MTDLYLLTVLTLLALRGVVFAALALEYELVAWNKTALVWDAVLFAGLLGAGLAVIGVDRWL